MWKFLGISLSLIFLAACGSSSDEPTELTFDMSNAVGIVKMASSGIDGVKSDFVPSLDITEGSQDSFQKLSAEGQLEPFYDGDLDINDTFIAPDNTAYLLLAEKSTYLKSNKKETCVLLKVNRDDSYSCVDDTLASVQKTCFFDDATNVLGYCTDAIQFDENGWVYYLGTDDSGFKVFRRSHTDDHGDADIEDLSTSHAEVYGYVVMRDSTMYFYGRTVDTGLYWLRRLDRDDSLHELEGTDSAVEWMKIFPDNKVYVGSTLFGEDGYLGTFTIDPATGNIVHKCWIEAGTSWLVGPLAKYNKCDPANPLGFSAPNYTETALCAAAGLTDPCLADMFAHNIFASPSGAVYVTLGQMDQKLWKLYPTVSFVNLTKILDVSVMEGWSDRSYMAIAGKNASGAHKFILYNITSGSETDLLPTMEIEIYHAKFSGSHNLWFDGLRFSDNTYVVGVIHLWPISADVSKQADGDEPNPTGEIMSTTPVPITDMQLFAE